MRIIAGMWRGRRIVAPKGSDVRPTPDRVREAWMSILHAELPGATVLDLFAGTGALGLEALSRGASRVEFIEQDARALRTITANIEALDAAPRTVVTRADVFRAIAGPRPVVDIALADPPYRHDLASRLVECWLRAPFSATLTVEHESNATLPDGGDRRKYGDTAITIFRH